MFDYAQLFCFAVRMKSYALQLQEFLLIGWLGLALTMAQAAPAGAPASTNQVPADNLPKAVLEELNVARTTPLKYVEYLKEHRRRFSGNLFQDALGARIMTQEGVGAVDEAIKVLSKQPPLAALKFSEGLSLAALDHAQDTGPSGLTGHDGSDGSTPSIRVSRYGKWEHTTGECIAYGSQEARQIVMQLIIDDGVANRGHRECIYNRDFRLAGIASAPHKTIRIVCVIDFAGGYMENRSAMRMRQAKQNHRGKAHK